MAEPTTDHADRTRAESDLETSLAVEAAAGTGKTRVLVTRLLNLIRSGKARLGEIAAVTFTEKAAGELKMRVRSELERLVRESADEEERRALVQALDDLGHAEIGTIHSLCANLLRERPVEAGVDPRFEVADELAASLIRERVWEEWLEVELAAGNPALLRAIRLGIPLDPRSHSLRKTASAMLGLRDLLGGRPRYNGPLPDALGLVGEILPKVEEVVRLVENDCREREPFASQMRHARDALIVARQGDEMSAAAILSRLNLRRKFPGKQKWTSQASSRRARDLHDALKEQHKELSGRLGQAVVAEVCEALCGFVEAYQRAKAEEGVLDFEDLLLFARDMLRRDKAAREHFKERFRYILVDEFQDTDPLQAEILFFLSERSGQHAEDWREVELEPGKLFLVGDPKQSIYRFRRADIEIYQRAKETVARRGAVLTLSESFRPVRGIADVVNAIFEPIIKRPDDGGYQPDYVRLVPHRREEPSRPPALVVYPPEEVQSGEENQAGMRRAEGRAVAAMIRHIVEEEHWEVFDQEGGEPRAARYADVAVLLPRFSDAHAYADAMIALGIPVHVVGGKRFFVTQEVHSLTALLRAIDSPHDGVALVAALRGPFFGVSDDDLARARAEFGSLDYLNGHDYPGALGAAMATLRRFHETRNTMPVAQFVQRVLEETGALELLAMRHRGEQQVANLLKVVERARALDATARVSLRGFVRWLAHLNTTEPDEQESPVAESGEDFVQVLTVHKAKGLQFPIVLLADISSSASERGNVVVMRESGQFAVKLSSGSKDGFSSSNFPDKSYEDKREEAERKRLFYVATTRARDYLVMFSGWTKGKVSGLAKFLGEWAGPESPPWGQESEVGFVFDTRSLDLSPVRGSVFRVFPPVEGSEPEPVRRRLEARREWAGAVERTLAEAGRGIVAKAPSHLHDGFEPPDAEVRARAALGTKIGLLVHMAIERAWTEPRERVERSLLSEARREGLDPEATERARRLVAAALDSEIMRRAARAEARFHEVPFSLGLDGVVLTGFMDLIFIEDGQAVVVDFKSDAVEADEVEGRAAVYRRQMLAYALAARRLLCKPVAEVIIFFLEAGRAVTVEYTEEQLGHTASELAAE